MLENGCRDLFPFRHTSGSEVKALMFDDGFLLAVPIAQCLVGFMCELYAGQSSSSTSDSHFCLIDHCHAAGTRGSTLLSSAE